MQQLEEENWDIEQYINSEIERDAIKESKLIQANLVEKVKGE